MIITIVNGTTRINSKSNKVTDTIKDIAIQKQYECKIVTLNNFTTLFTGEYVNLDNATPQQKIDLENIISSQIVIFVIPTYHHSIPGSLKNFFDIIDYKNIKLYDRKVIGLVSTNDDVDAIRHARVIIGEIFAFYKFTSLLPTKDVKINLDDIDQERLTRYIEYLTTYNNILNP